jgi:general L-amino acid transport system permease protein
MIAARARAWRRIFFGTWSNAAITLACLALLAWLLPPLVSWAIVDATWTGSARDCQAAPDGACWAFIRAKFWFSVYGLYPADERWRPALMLILFASMVGLSTIRALWSRRLIVAWLVAALAMFLLMRGGLLGLPLVETRNWGGITVTVFIAVFGLAAGYPLAILLALGRRARLPVVRALATAVIEGVRGVPLIALVFMAAVMVPLFLPRGLDIDQLFRIQAAYAIFSAAYLAEVVRGGLQALDPGQVEAARALGLRTWPMMRLVVLPQALRITVPAQVGTFITLLKDTTLVVIAGIFDFFTTLRAALGDSDWLGFTVEAYVYAALVYFVLCFAMSRYSRRLEAPREAAPR